MSYLSLWVGYHHNHWFTQIVPLLFFLPLRSLWYHSEFPIRDPPYAAAPAPCQHLWDAYSSLDTHMMRSTHTARSSSLTEEISPFAVAVLRPFLPFLVSLYFAFQLPRGMEETAEERRASEEQGRQEPRRREGRKLPLTWPQFLFLLLER